MHNGFVLSRSRNIRSRLSPKKTSLLRNHSLALSLLLTKYFWTHSRNILSDFRKEQPRLLYRRPGAMRGPLKPVSWDVVREPIPVLSLLLKVFPQMRHRELPACVSFFVR